MLYNVLTQLLVLSLFYSSQYFSVPHSSSPIVDKSSEVMESISPVFINKNSLGIDVSANSAITIDANSSAILSSKSEKNKLPLASLTKLMTAIVVLDQNPDWEKSIIMSSEDQRFGNIVYLLPGEEVKIRDLFDLMLVASSNEAAIALVKSVGFDIENFVKLMNQRALELELKNTKFVEPTGLDRGNISTANEIALISLEAFSRPEIREIIKLQRYVFTILNTGRIRIAYNTNKLLSSFLNDEALGYDIIGGKTGYLDESGYNMALMISKDNHPVIITTLGSKKEEYRWQDVKGLADWVFDSYKWPD